MIFVHFRIFFWDKFEDFFDLTKISLIFFKLMQDSSSYCTYLDGIEKNFLRNFLLSKNLQKQKSFFKKKSRMYKNYFCALTQKKIYKDLLYKKIRIKNFWTSF